MLWWCCGYVRIIQQVERKLALQSVTVFVFYFHKLDTNWKLTYWCHYVYHKTRSKARSTISVFYRHVLALRLSVSSHKWHESGPPTTRGTRKPVPAQRCTDNQILTWKLLKQCVMPMKWATRNIPDYSFYALFSVIQYKNIQGSAHKGLITCFHRWRATAAAKVPLGRRAQW